ncbi:unnamed protein product [Ixodes pacificus]
MESIFESFREWDAYTESSRAERSNADTKLCLINVNVRSIYRHWDQLMLILTTRLPSLNILMLSEVNADEAGCATFSLTGFHFFCLCQEQRKGGGIMMYINDK